MPTTTTSNATTMMKSSSSPYNNDKEKLTNNSNINHDTTSTPDWSLWIGALVWPCMLVVPLILSSPLSFTSYEEVFPESWYSVDNNSSSSSSSSSSRSSSSAPLPQPKVLGLLLGIFAVLVGQICILIFFYLFKYGYLSSLGSGIVGEHKRRRRKEPLSIQVQGSRPYEFMEGVTTHLVQLEGFGLLGLYLSVTWMFNWMPPSYYSFEGTIQYSHMMLCLIVQDGIQFAVHRLEHCLSPKLYQWSHKPHHRFTNPRLFDAFNGSLADTTLMILIPLFITAQLVRSINVWTYMAFGSSYAGWLTLIHSEYTYPWDAWFRIIGFGTAADHHVHHKVFKYNYGHLFMWFDQICGTYKSPLDLTPHIFNKNI